MRLSSCRFYRYPYKMSHFVKTISIPHEAIISGISNLTNNARKIMYQSCFLNTTNNPINPMNRILKIEVIF